MCVLTRPILEINLDKLVENYKYLKEIKSFGAVSAAVIKDDAYSLGADKVAQSLYEKADCRDFFVAHALEAEKVRPVVGDSKIYVLQGVGEDSLEVFQRLNLIPVINSWEQYLFWKAHKFGELKPVLHVETGLNRLGCRLCDVEKLSEAERGSFSFVMSHLACADAVGHFMNEKQLKAFQEIKAKYFPQTPASLSASDGVFLGKDYTFDMVRLGAAVYGINTAPWHEKTLQNVITIKAPVLAVSTLKEGDYVGYGATYKAVAERKLAVVSIGYGDGMFRSLSNVGKVFFNKVPADIIGRISMDNVICDVTSVPEVNVGDLATIVGDFYTVDEMGADAQTIGYEILSRFGKNTRFIRKYIES
ncbi:MAG: alanine racemase [Alphaproteobacteria bacterium]|nr:alanine racemase [Alphaproteobacteria bacterium]